MMAIMTEYHPHHGIRAIANRHDYLPAAGHDALLPCYDLLGRLLGYKRLYQALIAQADLTDASRVLEIGCGTGNLTIRAKRAHPAVELVGSDPDPRALARARRKARGLAGIRFERGYAQQLPYADGEFDKVLSSMMLHHLDDEVKARAAKEIFRVVRPGGTLHLVDIVNDETTYDRRIARLMKRYGHAAPNLGDSIPHLLSTAGFDCSEVATRQHRLLGRLSFYHAVRPDTG